MSQLLALLLFVLPGTFWLVLTVLLVLFRCAYPKIKFNVCDLFAD